MEEPNAAAGDGKAKVLPANDQIRELQTIIRDAETTRSDFVFYADRLIRLVTEFGLNQLPYDTKEVVTPNGAAYAGVSFGKGNSGVSIGRSGEAMEKALRECCRSIRIGKILVEAADAGQQPSVLYSRLWPRRDIVNRRILLLYPIMSSGGTVSQALRVLHQHGVPHERVTLLTLFATPKVNAPAFHTRGPAEFTVQTGTVRRAAVSFVSRSHPRVTLVTSEVDHSVPTHFGKRYFGTD